MPDLNHLQRALRILQRLMTHDRVTVAELHELLDKQVDKRSIQRMLNSIEGANIPLRFETGAHGVRYYRLQREFDFVPMMLEPDDLLAGILLGQFKELFQGTKIGENIKRVFERMEQLVPPDGVEIASAFWDVNDAFSYHEAGRVDIKPFSHVLMDLFKALLARKVCWVKYKGKSYQIHPYSLILHSGSLYAVVFQPYHKSYIYLSLPRIEEITPTDEIFERDPKFSLKEFMKDKFGIWSDKPATVRIKFAKLVRPSIEGRVWHHSQSIRELKSGDIVLTMKVGITEELIAWILRWGKYGVVQSPKKLQDRIKRTLRETLKSYR